MIKFNGWQRLWITTSYLYFLVIFIYAFIAWPTSTLPPKDEIKKEWFDEAFNKAQELPNFKHQTADDYKIQHPTLTYPQLVKNLQKDIDTQEDIKEAELKLQNHSKAFFPTREDFVYGDIDSLNQKYELQLKQTAAWIPFLINLMIVYSTPMLLIYTIGWLLAWTRKGFLTKQERH